MNTPSHRLAPSLVALMALGVGACGDDSHSTPPVETPPSTSAGTTGPSATSVGADTGDTGTTGDTGEDDDTGTTGDTDTGDTGMVVECESDCGLFGICVDQLCVCNTGYLFDAEAGECVVDDACLEVTLLEDGCRQRIDGFPAAALFFGVDFCSGDAATPEQLEALGLEFLVLENGVDIEENIESSAVILAKDVESYVLLAVDVSSSVAESEDMPAMIEELRGMVAGLVPQPDEPPVHVSVVLFGRSIETYVEFTDDLAAVDASLEALVTLLQQGENPINPLGTNLFDAVRTSLDELNRIRAFRRAVTAGGRLTTGTLVVVTDGKDTSGASKNVPATTNHMIAIGVSEEIDIDELASIGENGSFYAPDPADWPAAFDAITKRVDEYPERSYLVGYCSSATQGQPTIEVTLAHPGDPTFVPPTQTATCSFDADKFATNPPLCNAAELVGECDSLSCAGLTACGACSDDACCDELTGTCLTPQSASVCDGSDELCAPTDEICIDDACVAPSGQGEACDPGCDPGTLWCAQDVCEPTIAQGEACGSHEECSSLHCGPNPEMLFGPDICLPSLALYDSCEDGGTCPTGTYCDETCTLRKALGEPCDAPVECLSASCGYSPVFGEDDVCLPSGLCQLSWSDVL
jgi:hypothetical protein